MKHIAVRHLAVLLLLILLLTGVSPLCAQESSAERWLYNARERTEQGLGAHAAGAAEDADEAFAVARRLADHNPVALYNAGTSRLAADPDEAIRLLEESLAAEPAANTFYNLGNVRLAKEDARGAIEAFQSALRLDPDHRDAKFNLEWALKQVEEEEQSGEDDSEDEEEQKDQPQDQQEQDQEQQQQQQQPPPPQEPDPDAEPQPQNERNSALPQFSDLPDMTAAEAAEILEAVENLEREERRRQAMESAKTSSRELKDW